MPAPTVTLSFDSALGGGTTSTCTGPATVAQGDLLIMLVGADDTQTALTGSTTGSPTWPSGWTEIQGGVNRSAGGDVSCHAAWKVAGAGDVATGTGVNYALTWTAGAEGSAAFLRIPAGEFDSGTPIDASSVTTTGAGATSIALAGITTTVADTLLIGYAVADESSAYVDYWSNPPISGWTSLLTGSAGQGGSNTYACVAYSTQAAAGATGNKTATIRVENDAIAGFLIAVRPAGGVTGTMSGNAPSPSQTATASVDVTVAGTGSAPDPTQAATLAADVSVTGGGSAPEPAQAATLAAEVSVAGSGNAPSPTSTINAAWSVGTIGNKAALLGLADGAAITSANSGNGGQTAFDAVTLSGGATLTYTAATASMTASDTAGGGVARAEWTAKFATNTLVVEAKLDTLPTNMSTAGDCAIFEIRSSSALIARVEIDDATGRVYVYGPSGGSVADSGATVIGSGGARISLGVDVPGGALYPRLYLADDGESSTAAWSTTVTGLSLGSSVASVLRIGQTNSAPPGVVHIEHVRVNDQQTASLGGWPADAVTAALTGNAPNPTQTGTLDVAVTVTGAGEAPSPTQNAAGALEVAATLGGNAPDPSTTAVVDSTATAALAELAPEPTSSTSATADVVVTMAGDAPAPTQLAAVDVEVGTDVLGTITGGPPGPESTATLVLAAVVVIGGGPDAPTSSVAAVVAVVVSGAGYAPQPTQATDVAAGATAVLAADAPEPVAAADVAVAVAVVVVETAPEPTSAMRVTYGVWAAAARPRATITPNLATATIAPNRAAATVAANTARAEVT